MFCPRCGQQQASEEVRFCSRCGLQLDALTEFVESGGRLASRDASEDLPALTARQRGTRMAFLILVAGLIFGVLAVILAAVKEDFFVLLLGAALIITAGVMRMLYGMLLEDDSARKKAARHSARDEKRDAAR